MFTIHLKDLKFHAYHGLYDIEKEKGNHFELNVAIDVGISDKKITAIEQTVDYSKVYAVIEARMKMATPLLETLLQDMALLISAMDKRITKINLHIIKLNPPIPNFNGLVGVQYTVEI